MYDRKGNYWNRFVALLDEYPRMLIVTADNVGSNQLQKIRKSLRGEAVILMGKKTLMRKVVREQWTKNPEIAGILPLLKGNVGLVFTNGDLADVRTKLVGLKIRAAAKAGAIAPIDVVIPRGGTSLEPTKTSFFQALSIHTRINRGSIEIPNDIRVVTAGQKITLSQAALLQMLNIKPFQYGLKVVAVYDNGVVNLVGGGGELDDDQMVQRAVARAVADIAALGGQIGYQPAVAVATKLTGGRPARVVTPDDTHATTTAGETDIFGLFGDDDDGEGGEVDDDDDEADEKKKNKKPVDDDDNEAIGDLFPPDEEEEGEDDEIDIGPGLFPGFGDDEEY